MNRKDGSTPANRALWIVSGAVLLASSTWFSGTAVAPTLIEEWRLSQSEAAWLTIAVQLGFISGTFLYSILNLSDIFNARRVFFFSAVAGAFFNAGFGWIGQELVLSGLLRFLTGITLAGVYPVGMKLVASWFRTGLGWRLGIMVGALTAGTASPYLIQALGAGYAWRNLVLLASLSALAGGLTVLILLPDGPYLSRRASFDVHMVWKIFQHAPFRNTAFGYFGHMWELYAFWALLGFFLEASATDAGARLESIPWIVFLTISAGAAGCVLGGRVSRWIGERRVALISLAVSTSLCLLSSRLFGLHGTLQMVSILVWGFFVVSDSPQFSALAARYCPAKYTGTALTIQNGIGFGITAVSLQLTPILAESLSWKWAFTYLAVGPAIGFYFMRKVPSRSQGPLACATPQTRC